MCAGLTYLIVFDRRNGQCRVVSEDEPRVDAAVSQWIDSGRTRDTIIQLTTITGVPYRLLASEVSNWIVSSPSSRQAEAEIEKALAAEGPPL